MALRHHQELAAEAEGPAPGSDWNMPRCVGSSSSSEAALEFRFSSEAIGTWNPWDEKGANGEDPGCGSGALSILLYAVGGNEDEVDEVEAEAGLKSLPSRAAGRDGKLPGMRAPPVGTILFPILAIVVCFASEARLLDPNCRTNCRG